MRDNVLEARVTVGDGGAGIQSIALGNVTNARVDVGGQTNLSGSVTVPFASVPPTTVLTVRRASGSGSVHVPFTVVDGCGSWPTFVGGGESVWGTSGGSAAAPTQPTPVAGLVPGAACGQFANHAAAQAHLRANPSDPRLLDKNRNGIACEGADGAGFMSQPWDQTPVART